MLPAGLLARVRPRAEPLPRGEGQEPEEGHRPEHPALQRPLHHVHALRALHPRGDRHRRADGGRPRRPRDDRRLPREAARQSARRQRHRHLPGGRAPRQGVPLPAARVVPDQDPVHRRPHCQRRQPVRRAQPGPRAPHQAAHQHGRQHVVDHRRGALLVEARAFRESHPHAARQGPPGLRSRQRRAGVEGGHRQGRGHGGCRRECQAEDRRHGQPDADLRGRVHARLVGALARSEGGARRRPGAVHGRGPHLQGRLHHVRREGPQRTRRASRARGAQRQARRRHGA